MTWECLDYCPGCEPAPPLPCKGKEAGATRTGRAGLGPLSLADQVKVPGWPLWGFLSCTVWGQPPVLRLGGPSETLVPGLELGTKAAPTGLPGASYGSQESVGGDLLPSMEWLFLLTPLCFLSQVQN